jgi:hypothetical protein
VDSGEVKMKKSKLLKSIKDYLADVWPERSPVVIVAHAEDLLAKLIGIGKTSGASEKNVMNYCRMLNIKNIVIQYTRMGKMNNRTIEPTRR